MSTFLRAAGLVVTCLLLAAACSQPLTSSVDSGTEVDTTLAADALVQGGDDLGAADSSGNQYDAPETGGLDDAGATDTGPPECVPADCSDGWPCTLDTCKAGVCSHLALDTTPCDDSDPCTVGEGCVEGSCGGGSDANCDDGNTCTLDSCDTGNGCAHKATLGTCSDGDACTSGEACKAGACTGGTPKFCGDGNYCTDDGCDSAKGCVFTPNSAPCDSDSNVCTVDACAGGKCAYLPVAETSTACDDGSPCTQEDHCEKGKCVGAAAVWTVDFAAESGVYEPGFHSSNGIAVGTYQKLHLVDWGGHEVWNTPGFFWFAKPLTNGWIAGSSESNVSLLDSNTGAVTKTSALSVDGKGLQWFVPAPTLALSGLLVPIRKMGDKCASLLELSAGGEVVKELQPKGCYFPNGTIVRRTNGDFLWPVETLSAGPLAVGLLRVDLAQDTIEDFPTPALTEISWKYWNDKGTAAVTEAGDGSVYLARIRLADDTPPTLGVYLWRLSPVGVVQWSQILRLPGATPDTVWGQVAIAALEGGELEVWAGTQPSQLTTSNEPFASWRLAGDGHVIWSRNESERRRVASSTIGALGNGVVGSATYYDYQLLGSTGYRLTRSDAFGNITCAESGPCWDKPATYCDDGDPCTNDLCGVWWNGCHHTPFAEGSPCMPGKSCKKGQCVP